MRDRALWPLLESLLHACAFPRTTASMEIFEKLLDQCSADFSDIDNEDEMHEIFFELIAFKVMDVLMPLPHMLYAPYAREAINVLQNASKSICTRLQFTLQTVLLDLAIPESAGLALIITDYVACGRNCLAIMTGIPHQWARQPSWFGLDAYLENYGLIYF